jgi:hypothetical protein
VTLADWTMFFPPDTRVLALPGWRNPRLFVPTQNPIQRWRQSSLYPSSRLRARLYRLSLRLGAAAKLTQARAVRADGWPLGDFVEEALPQVASAVVLVGTPGPAQQTTVQLHDAEGRILGYLKYGETAFACARLRQEWFMLSHLPPGLGPKPLKRGMLSEGEAILKSFVAGKQLRATPTPPPNVLRFLVSLDAGRPLPLEDHPWVRNTLDVAEPGIERWFEPLAARSWSTVIQHGDLVPWNLLESPGNPLRAIDWEHGALETFPHLDLAHYILQTAALVYRRPPLEAARRAAGYLAHCPALSLTGREADAITRLAAYDAYVKYLDEGQAPEVKLQAWRRVIWTGGEADDR